MEKVEVLEVLDTSVRLNKLQISHDGYGVLIIPFVWKDDCDLGISRVPGQKTSRKAMAFGLR